MITGKVIVIGLSLHFNLYFSFVLIIIFKEDRLDNPCNSKDQISPMEEISIRAIKIRKLATELQNKLLE